MLFLRNSTNASSFEKLFRSPLRGSSSEVRHFELERQTRKRKARCWDEKFFIAKFYR